MGIISEICSSIFLLESYSSFKIAGRYRKHKYTVSLNTDCTKCNNTKKQTEHKW